MVMVELGDTLDPGPGEVSATRSGVAADGTGAPTVTWKPALCSAAVAWSIGWPVTSGTRTDEPCRTLPVGFCQSVCGRPLLATCMMSCQMGAAIVAPNTCPE